MNRFTKTLAVATAIVGLAFVGRAWNLQDGGAKPKQEPTKTDAAKQAEKERKGKAHGADVNMKKDGSLQIEVRLLVGDKWEEVYVDHVTKKVTVPPPHKEGEEDEDDEDH